MATSSFVGSSGRSFAFIRKSLRIILDLQSHQPARMVSKEQNGLPEALRTLLPYFAYGKVVHGFGRGSRELGCPTANMSDQVVSAFPEALPCGVYYGLASVDNGPVHRMVTSVGWNPQYNNEKKSIETHIMHDFGKDFYGSLLKIMMLGYLRPMQAFPNLDALKEAIQSDITNAHEILDSPQFQSFRQHVFFTPGGESNMPHARKISDIIPNPKRDNTGESGDQQKSVK